MSFEIGVSDYTWVDPRLRAGSTQFIDSDTADRGIRIATDVGNAANEKCSFDIIIIDPRNAFEFTDVIQNNTRIRGDGIFEGGYGGGSYVVAETVDFLRLV